MNSNLRMIQEIVPDLYTIKDTYFRFNPNDAFPSTEGMSKEEQKRIEDEDFAEISKKE